MKEYILILCCIGILSQVYSQKYYTKSGDITFESNAPLEKITAENKKATSVMDTESGAIEWAVLINAFRFEKALMEEHFNENYMESSKFPKAVFRGRLDDISTVDFSKNGTYTTNVSGELEIRGVKNNVSTGVVFEINDGTIVGKSSLTVLVADYNIEIPKIVRENIAKEVLITIEADYQPL